MNIDELRDYNKIILRLGLEKHSKSVRLSSLGVEGWSIEDHHSISDITTIIEQADTITSLRVMVKNLGAKAICKDGVEELTHELNNASRIIAERADKIAELEANNALLKRVEQIFNDSPDLTFDCVQRLFKDELAKRDIEMQLKAVDNVINEVESLSSAVGIRNRLYAVKNGLFKKIEQAGDL